MYRIFYSWQMNTPQAVNRYLIRDSLAAAVKGLAREAEVDEATRGVAGSPSIFTTILSKIDQCAVFVADLTLVALADPEDFTCNPNVLVEYGYALAKRGENRLIPVINTSFGRIESLPFDLRHKAVRVSYDLASDSPSDEIKKVEKELTGRLRSELRLLLEDPSSTLNLSVSEVAVARHLLLEQSTHGAECDYAEQEHIASATGLELSTAKRAVADLASRGYLERLGAAGTDSPPVKLTPLLFWDLDPYVHGWDPRFDARSLAEELVSNSDTGHGRLGTRQFMQKTGWRLRRLNPALLYLLRNEIVRENPTVVPDLVTLEIYETEATRRFLSGSYDPDRRRQG